MSSSMAEVSPSLDDIVLLNESSDELVPGDVSVWRNEDVVCSCLEHWWVEEAYGFAFTAAGQRIRLDVDDHDRVCVAAKEDVADGQTIVRRWLESQASAVLEARRAKASKRRLFARKVILSDFEQRGELPQSIEGLIDYVGFDG